MNNDLVTIDSILEWFVEAIKHKDFISPSQWLDSAQKLNILKEEVDNQIAEFETEMALKEAELIEQGESAAKAEKLRIRAINYKEYLKTMGKEKRIIEHIRLSKKQATMIAEHKDF